MLVSKRPSRAKYLASCAVKLCEQKCSGYSDIRCFVFFIFVVCANHENIFTTKISRSTVVSTRYDISQVYIDIFKQYVFA